MIFFPAWRDFEEFKKVALENEWYDKECFDMGLVKGDQGSPCPIIGFTFATFTLRACGGNHEDCGRFKKE